MTIRRVATCFAVVLSLACTSPADRFADARAEYERISSEIGGIQIQQTITELMSHTRVGTAGPDFKSFFAKLIGVNEREIFDESFSLVCPDPKSTGTITTGSTSLTVHPLWPNGVQTSACNITSRLVDVGNGTLHEMNGKPIAGNIAVLNFNSGSNWRNCLRLGAAAVVFVEPKTTMRGEGECKWSEIPVNLPRFYVRASDASLLREMIGRKVSLTCKQALIDQQARNYFVKIIGTDPALRDEWVMLSSYADTVSVVPSLPHGADQSTGLASFIQITRRLMHDPPKRSVLLVITEGHFLAMQGMRNFIERRFRDDWAIIGGNPPQFSFAFDLSSGNSTVCSITDGWWAEYTQENKDRERSVSRVLGEHVQQISKWTKREARELFFDGVNDPDGRHWKNAIPGRVATEAEIVNLSAQNCIAFTCMEDSRSLQDTPFDTFENVRPSNTAEQTRTIAYLLWHMLNDTQDEAVEDQFVAPFRRGGEFKRISFTAGFGTIYGQTLQYDPAKSFTPNIVVPDVLVCLPNRYHTYLGIRGMTMVRSDHETGEYSVIGVPTTTCKEPKNREPIGLWAFRLDESSRIEYALDISQLYSLGYRPYWMMNTAFFSAPLVLSKCESLTITGVTDPLLLKPIRYFFLMNANNHGYTRSGMFVTDFGQLNYRRSVDDDLVLFVDPNEQFSLAGYFDAGEVRMAYINSTEAKPEGAGQTSADFPPSRRLDAALVSAKNLWQINEWRLSQLRKHHIANPGIERIHKQAKEAILKGEEAAKANNHAEALRWSNAAWGLTVRCHPLILSATKDVLNGLLFYLALLLPSSYLLERLLIASKNVVRQLSWCSAIFISIFLLLMWLHPAFDLTSNPFIIFISFSLSALSLIVIGILMGKFEQSLKSLEELKADAARGKSGQFTLFLTAMAIGLSNLRRRKARTLLTALTLTIVTLICLSFTSIESNVRYNALDAQGKPQYTGILMRNYSMDPIDENAFRVFANEFPDGTPISRRVWFFGGETSQFSVVRVEYQGKFADLGGILGVDSAESAITKLHDCLATGSGWIAEGEPNEIVLPSEVAKQLGLYPFAAPRAKVRVCGMDFVVVGTTDESKLKQVVDLDNESVLPADFRASDRLASVGQGGGLAFRNYLRLDASKVAIIPASTALNLGGDIRNVAVGLETGEKTQAALDALMVRSGLNLYASVTENGESVIKRFSAVAGSKGNGFEFVVLPVIIAVLSVLNTMVASVMERKSEISILSSVGLSPRQISFLFFSESLVYAILGSTIGYIVAQVAALLLRSQSFAEGLNINYSSGTAIIASGLVAAIVLLSTIYPAKLAARAATPSGITDWTAARPEGDEWSLTLPFTVSFEQAQGLAKFYSHWLAQHAEYSIGSFVTEKTVDHQDSDRLMAGARCWLRPFDLGVQQEVEVLFEPTEVARIYQVSVRIMRVSGDPGQWVRVNRPFLSELRQQFLDWRTLGPEIQSSFGSTEHPTPAQT